MFTNLKQKQDEVDLPSGLQMLSSSPLFFSTTYIGHSAAHTGSHGSNNQYTPTNISPAFPVINILCAKLPIFTYNFAAATSQHPNMDALFDFNLTLQNTDWNTSPHLQKHSMDGQVPSASGVGASYWHPLRIIQTRYARKVPTIQTGIIGRTGSMHPPIPNL
ncbi:hypothetical protein DFJ43DRAFT_1162362 [Lentinula guzmanii]|uniref:Uncharacterized protein n=1 Tax=Lentinula guzmanii TaxID=2804957 RepID=A0AA38MUE4_9AGAR|nr:hypothetical protein DFJ43DRAFT_1162362 [Lentinula guzmanii]